MARAARVLDGGWGQFHRSSGATLLDSWHYAKLSRIGMACTHGKISSKTTSGIPSYHDTATSLWIALDRCITSAKRCMRGRRRTSGMLGMSS